MLEFLHLKDVGPAPELNIKFSNRLNIITGDNGLGKSFLLDACWFSLTRSWAGMQARPLKSQLKPEISFRFKTVSTTDGYASKYDRYSESWTVRTGRPGNPGLVLYARADGGFSLWDPARNYWKKRGGIDLKDRPAAYHFNNQEIWKGIEKNETWICNGLIRDWASWQDKNDYRFALLRKALQTLSPSPDEKLEIGKLTRISLEDSQEVPTIRMPYGQEVPVVFASEGMRRIIALAYVLVWAWGEHLTASELLSIDPTNQITVLIDEVEAHLHPQWQRRIIQSLLEVMGNMTKPESEETASERSFLSVQLILATHSPLLLASVEPYFDEKRDRLFHLDLNDHAVTLNEIRWSKQGDATNWLVSEIFGLEQARSLDAERAIESAEAWMRDERDGLPEDLNSYAKIHKELLRVLAGHDAFWPRWIIKTEYDTSGETTA